MNFPVFAAKASESFKTEHIFLLRDQLWFSAGASVPLGAVCVAGAWRSSARTDGCADDTTDRQLFAHIFTGLLDSSLFYFVLRRMRLFAPPFLCCESASVHNL